MLSILIPVYNYNIADLLEELVEQTQDFPHNWEIIFLDDASDPNYYDENTKTVHQYNNEKIQYLHVEENIGNGAIRNGLIEKAKFPWLLFLDADVLPVFANFIKKYSDYFRQDKALLIGGDIKYKKNPADKNQILRWKYGKKREEYSLAKRIKNPLLHLRGANFMVHKDLLIHKKFVLMDQKYGFVDTRFFLQFEKENVFHIENPVYHLGLENNQIFLNKTELAIQNAWFLYQQNHGLAKRLRIIRTYKKLVRSHLVGSFASIFGRNKNKIKRNLLSENPSLFLFQFYKLGYLCSLATLSKRAKSLAS